MVYKVTEAERKKSKRSGASESSGGSDKGRTKSRNLAYLDPQSMRVKGWSRDTNGNIG